MIVELVLQLIPLLCLLIINPIPIPIPSAAASPSLAKPNCAQSCPNNNIIIPFPFGIGKDCYHDPSFEITCNKSFNSFKPFLIKFNLEVLNISISSDTGLYGFPWITVNGPISSSCKSSLWGSINLSGSPFRFSDSNSFTVLGCGNALLKNQSDETLAGCTSLCENITMKASCYGINCCQTSIPSDLDFYNVTTTRTSTDTGSITSTSSDCTYAFLLDDEYSAAANFSIQLLTSLVRDTEHAPMVLVALITNQSLFSVHVRDFEDHSCSEGGTTIDGATAYYCYCYDSYEGNPYIPDGCQIREECAECKGRCYSSSSYGKFQCYRRRPSVKGIILGVSISGGSLLLLLGSFGLYKVARRMRQIKLKKKFFKRNGGLLLQQQMSSNKGTVEKTKIYTSTELEKATDNFNQNRILGQGGQGTVYKGMLTDGRIVAIKRSKLVDESQLEQFINEVVILSQINHRNVVKLLGCCLETDVPLLVYEFISNGNLFELIHDQNEEFPFSWEMRLQIATDVAGAVAYLHSASSIPIYHRDIKSTNILLDDKYKAKVSDFGTSRSISIEQTHLTTLVHGTFGYLDPEYFQSSQFTEKSDVYSFGVVLAELLTGQKPISSIRLQEEKSLATFFLLSSEENRVFDILDARVLKEGGREEIVAVANLATRCLNLNGKKRPTMKEVSMELEGIRKSPILPLNSKKNFQQDECIVELTGPFDGASVSISLCSDHTGSDAHPLLYDKV